MIVDRLRAQAARHNWFATGVDLLILVLGVFLGLQASNWNQARSNRAEGGTYRVRLISDLRDNEADLRDRRGYYGAVRAHAKAALAALDRPAAGGDAAFLIHAYEATQITPRRIKRFTYDELLSRGATPWIGDAGLREQVANYYVGVVTTSATFDTVTPYRELVRGGMADAAQGAVRRACPERVLFAADGSGRAALAPHCAPLPLDPASVARNAAEVRRLPDLRGALNRLISDHDGKLALIGPLIDHARDLRRRLAVARVKAR